MIYSNINQVPVECIYFSFTYNSCLYRPQWAAE